MNIEWQTNGPADERQEHYAYVDGQLVGRVNPWYQQTTRRTVDQSRIDWPTVAKRILSMRGPYFLAAILYHKERWELDNGLTPVEVVL